MVLESWLSLRLWSLGMMGVCSQSGSGEARRVLVGVRGDG